jgi:cysteine synthase B
MLCAARGYRAKLVIPQNASPERIKILRAYGAEIVFSSPLENTDGAIRLAREMAAQDPAMYLYADQYSNPANWQAHYRTTGVEVWEQTQGRVTHFVAGLGTSGTFTGTGRRLREFNPDVRLLAVQPDAPFHGLEGLKHYETAMIPRIYDAALADGQVDVATEEAHAMVKRLAREEGLFAGVSAAAAAVAAIKVAATLREGVVVTVFPDAAFKYLSDRFWEEK